MGKGQQQREDLFQYHTENLQAVCPRAGNVFVCPICFRVFTPKDLDDQITVPERRLSIGHVWPEDFHLRSQRAKQQQVLLCRPCNSKAGSHGDAMMQKLERLRASSVLGKLGETRLVEVIPSPPHGWTKEPARFRAEVETQSEDGKQFTVTPVAKQSDPKELAKFHHYTTQGPCSVTVYSPKVPAKVRAHFVPFVQVGWLTSAYLLSFYTFGYRYIFQACLDPIRAYILSSFEKKVNNRLFFQESQTLGVSTCNVHFNDHPEIDFVLYAFKEEVSPHLETSFLRYHVRLPVQHIDIPLDVSNELEMSNKFATLNDVRNIVARASGHRAHAYQCSWDEILGKPDYYVEGQTLDRYEKAVLTISTVKKSKTKRLVKSDKEAFVTEPIKAIELSPENAVAYFNRGVTYANLGEYHSALAGFNSAIELNPKYAEAYNNRGNTYSTLEKYDSALADYDKAIQLTPENAVAYFNRGVTYADIGEYEKGTSDLEHFLDLSDDPCLREQAEQHLRKLHELRGE